MRMTPLEIFRKPINLRNVITPAGKNMQRMHPLKDDAVKTDVFEVDISGELLHKGVLHGQGPFLNQFLLGYSWWNIPYRTVREKSITSMWCKEADRGVL
jgi:hypothetical protein